MQSLDPAPWWQGATFYQIYPRSFYDANGDGTGDLAGVMQKLDHVAELGVDGIWLSPFYTSPMRDFGYDLLDHCAVDPVFGSMDDFDRLLSRAHQLGLKVLIDMVWSHTAIEHEWFSQSRASRDGPKADWYVWADARPDGSPPTNWQSWMGGPTWTWETGRQQYYLHNFLSSMPDLNLHHGPVQDALLDIGRFWLQRGVDGFRFDTVNYYCHDPLLRDNPPRTVAGLPDCPAALQRHLYDVCQPQTLPFLSRIRALLDGYGQRLSVAEIGSESNLERMQEYTRGADRLHTAYSFVLLGEALGADQLAALMDPWQGPPAQSGWPSWALSNHDSRRVATRWAQDDPALARVLTWLLLALRGNTFIYQGEELGLPHADLAREDILDPVGLVQWPRNKGRDGCRTPMPWTAEATHAGFSTARPWLPVAAGHAERAVDLQRKDPGSHWHCTQAALRFRREHPAMRRGDFQCLQVDAEWLVVQRQAEGDAVLLAFNLGATRRALNLPAGLRARGEPLALHQACLCEGQLDLPPRSAIWLATC